MLATTPRTLPQWFTTGCAVACYLAFFWRTFKRNPGNRLVECGAMTLMVFFVLMGLVTLSNIPGWLFGAWLSLVVLLCLTTLFFLAQRGVRALRHRKLRP